jgi:predicted NACHT family NTPase
LEAVLKGVQTAEAKTINFERYLQSLTTTYQQWWKLYALTDAVGQIKEQEHEQALPSPFDFGLMVQTVSKEREFASSEADLTQEKREKTERLPVLEGIRKYADAHMLLVGRPGSGKSTALIRLLLEMATSALTPDPSPKLGRGEPERIPVLVELRYWQNSVIERIQAFLHKHDPTLSLDDSALTSLLRQGRFLLLMDGLNELPSETARTQLASFRQDHSKVPMIFTTRDLGLGGDLGIEKKLEMQPLTEGQMQEFIRAYVPDQAEAMLRQLNDRLREFGQTPLLLWMLCEVFQQSPEHQMPSNLAGIFQAFTRMYEDSSVRKHEVALLKGDVRPLSDRRLWKPALQAIAATMMQGETKVDFRRVIPRHEAERELSRIFPNEKFPARDILDDLLKYHLLQNRSADQIEFRHQLIQEYYAAEYLLLLLPELSDEQLKRDYLNLLKWTEPIALMLALIDKDDQALRVIKLAADDVDLSLGAKLTSKIRSKLQQNTINHLITETKLCEIIKIHLLGLTQSDSAIPYLLSLLERNDFDLQYSLSQALERIGTKTLAEKLIDFIDSENAIERIMAISALGNLFFPEVELALRKALQHSSPETRWSAAEALGNHKSQESEKDLILTLSDSSPTVRSNAAIALGNMGSCRAISRLSALLFEEDLPFNIEIAYALAKIGSHCRRRI